MGDSYPTNPTTVAEALQTLAAFARTAPGALPSRVEAALRIASVAAASPSDFHEIMDLTVETLDEMNLIKLRAERAETYLDQALDILDRLRGSHGDACICVPCRCARDFVRQVGGDPIVSERQKRDATAAHKEGVGGAVKATPPEVWQGLEFLLTRIGSWSNARWDQHLRERLGDEHAESIIRWLAARSIRPYIVEGSSGRRLQEETPAEAFVSVRDSRAERGQ